MPPGQCRPAGFCRTFDDIYRYLGTFTHPCFTSEDIRRFAKQLTEASV